MPNNEDPKKDMSIAEEAGLPENWVPIDSTPIVPSNMAAGTNPYGGGSLPPNFNLQPDTLSTNYKGPGIPAVRLMPVQGNPAINAQTQSIVEKAISEIPPTVIPASTPGVTDGLIHGDLIWDIDDAYSYWREDFRFLNVVTGSLTAGTTNPVQCELPWLVALTTSANGYSYNPGPPFIGALMLGSGSVAANCSFLVPQNNSEPDSANSIRSIDALFEHPNWKMVWNFGLLRPTNSTTATTTAFALTKTSTYVGLANTPALSSYGTSTPARPIAFTGLRYDTDLGAALTLTGATAGVGTTAYAGTITNGGSNAYVGYKFTITGFSGGDTANNGTFTCTASSTTVLTLNNASGVTGSTGASLTATGPQINDSHFVFESVCNSAFINVSTRINFQGNTADTGITPTEGHFYRLEMTCTAVGTVVMTLTDSIQTAGVTTAVAQFSANIVVPTFTCTNISYQAGDGAAYITNSGTSNTPFAAGSIVTVAHTSATGIDGVQYVIATAAGGASINYLSAASFSNTNASSGTLTGYPAVYPYLAFGNDTNASANSANTKGLFIDFVAFIWNPGVGGNTSPASNPLLSRYF